MGTGAIPPTTYAPITPIAPPSVSQSGNVPTLTTGNLSPSSLLPSWLNPMTWLTGAGILSTASSGNLLNGVTASGILTGNNNPVTGVEQSLGLPTASSIQSDIQNVQTDIQGDITSVET